MGKTSFQNLQKLVREIDAKIAQMKDGNLSVNELEDLVKASADLHERLAVIRYKAYEKFGEPEAQQEHVPMVEKSEPAEEPIAFDISFSDNPIIEKKSEPVVVKDPEPIEFSAPVFEKPVPETKKVTVAEPEVKKPIHVLREEVKPDSSSLHEKFLKEDDVPLNEKLKAEEDVPLRKKLGKTAVKDLRTEIGIGKKFEYINFLFAGDAKAYDTAINELNNCPDAETAKQKLNVYASVYRWDLEEKTILKFVELVERRFI